MTRPVRRRRGVAIAGALLGALLVVAAPAVAAWTDTAAVGDSTLSTATVPPPTLGCGLLGLGSVTFTWPAVAGASGYRITFTDTTGTSSVSADVTGTSVVATSNAVIASGKAVLQTRVTYPGGTTWTSVASASRSYSVVAGAVGLCA